MNLFPVLNVRADHDDAVRRWADIEGKSPSMSDDLIRRYAISPRRRPLNVTQLARLAEVIALTLEAVRLLRTR